MPVAPVVPRVCHSVTWPLTLYPVWGEVIPLHVVPPCTPMLKMVLFWFPDISRNPWPCARWERVIPRGNSPIARCEVAYTITPKGTFLMAGEHQLWSGVSGHVCDQLQSGCLHSWPMNWATDKTL